MFAREHRMFAREHRLFAPEHRFEAPEHRFGTERAPSPPRFSGEEAET
jgi:hypothetical protein